MLPREARTFPLTPGTKIPTKGTRGHLDARRNDPPLDGEYGIALDGQFLVVDFDTAPPERGKFTDASGVEQNLPETWVQQTRRGEHWLYRVPTGANLKETRNRKFKFGDVKVRGYIVGPGSQVAGHLYTVLNAIEPVEAPAWLVEYAATSQEVSALDTEADRGSIPVGEQDNRMTQVGGLLRRMGLSEEAVAKGLTGVNHALFDPPIAQGDIRRIAKSVSKYASQEQETGPLRPAGWVSMDEVAYVGPPTRWWVRGFVPKGELVLLFGPGGVGKSSFGSWLAAQVTQKGGRVAVACIEEPVKRFAWRSNLNGGHLSHILAIPSPAGMVLPRDAKALKEALEVTKTDVLWIDSIYSHFESVEGQNAAERARRCLAPLAEIAQETGVTIVGVFHLNKAREYLGSVEMVNVPRYVLEATRGQGKPLYVGVHKTNLWSPGYRMAFAGIDVPAIDPETGEVQQEEVEDGSLADTHFTILSREENIPELAAASQEAASSDNTTNIDTVGDFK